MFKPRIITVYEFPAPESIMEQRLCFDNQKNYQAKDILRQIHENEKADQSIGFESTFSSLPIGEFLKTKNLNNLDDFETHFKTHRLHAYLQYKKTAGTITSDEKKLFQYYEDHKNPGTGELPDVHAKSLEAEQAWKANSTDTTLKKEKTTLTEIALLELAGKVQFLTYFEGQQHFKERREKVLYDGEGFDKTVSRLYEDVKHNWRKMKSGEKWFMVIGGILTMYMLKGSENKTVQDIKKALWGATKIGLGLAFLNKLIKLPTGKSGVGWVSEMAATRAESLDTISGRFRSDKEEARIFTDGFVFLNTLKYSDVMRHYSNLKAQFDAEPTLSGETVLQKAKRRKDLFRSKLGKYGELEPWEVFIAMDVFFRRYELLKVEKKYKTELNISFPDMVMREMVDDPDPFFTSILGDSIASIRGSDKDGDVGLLEKLKMCASERQVLKERTAVLNMNDFFTKHASTKLGKFETAFSQAKTAGALDTSTNTFQNKPYFEDSASGAAYYIAHLKTTSDPDGSIDILKNLKQAKDVASTFLQSQSAVGHKYMESVAFTTDSHGYLTLYVRAPLQNTIEYSARQIGQWNGGTAVEMRDKEFLESGGFRTMKQEDELEIKLKYALSFSDFTKLKNYFVLEYAGKGWTEEEIIKKMKELNNREQTAIFGRLDISPGDDLEVNRSKKAFDKIDEFVGKKLDDLDIDDHNIVAEQILTKNHLARLRAEYDSFQNPSVRTTRLNTYRSAIVIDLWTEIRTVGVSSALTSSQLETECKEFEQP